MKHLLLILAFCGFFDARYPVFAQVWFQTSAPLADWNGVASSADGTKLVAVCCPFFFDLDGVYVSTNSGATWNITSAPNDPNTNSWTAVASSTDGVKLVAVAGGGDGAIYTSANSGLTWRKTSAPIDDYDCVASSADGTKLVAACNYGHGIYISIDSGANWVNTYNGRQFGGEFWHSVAISADGSKVVAAEGDGYVAGYPPSSCMLAYSTNSAVSWLVGNNVPADELWWAAACSANGTVMVGAALHSYASTTRHKFVSIEVSEVVRSEERRVGK